MDALAVNTVGSRHLSQPCPAGGRGHFQRAKAWVWDVCVPATKKLLPAVESTYRENKTWCDRLGGVAVVVGVCTGMISFSTLCYLGSGFAAGSLYCRGSMKEELAPDVTINGTLPTPSGLAENSRCSKADIVALMKVIDDLLMKLTDMNARVDALTAERTMAAVNRLHQEASRKKGVITQVPEDDISLKVKEALQIASVIRPRIFLALLHEFSGINSSGDEISDIVSGILGRSFHNPCPEIRRKHRADYEQLADAFLASGKANAQGEVRWPGSQKVQVDILHGITAPWMIAGEGRVHEVMHKIDKAASVAFHQWKMARKGTVAATS